MNIAIGNRIGKAVPYIKVTKTVFKIVLYLKWIRYSGPEYKSTYC